MERERLGSRLGFILLSAGCAIGIGNVWKFPYITGQYGGGAFVLVYLFFLVILGVPVLTMEFSLGRAAQKSPVKLYQQLEKPGSKWHIHGYLAMIGNILLMMFYTTVAAWMIMYFIKTAKGDFVGHNTDQIATMFNDLKAAPVPMIAFMAIVVIIGFGVCSFGVHNGLEKVTKIMMLALLIIMVVLAVNSIMLKGGTEGLEFYLKPDFDRMKEIGIGEVIVGAMNQAFFTLSLGIGSMAIFGSYLNKDRALLGEAVNVAVLDTFVAITSGLIIFPACFSYGIEPDAGPDLLFITLPNIFNNIPLGRLWGSLFFVFMSFAALSTVLAVFENIISCTMDVTGWGRKKTCLMNGIAIFALSLPCILGFNVLDNIKPFGGGSNIMDLEDFIVSNLLLPIGSLCFVLFCVLRYGWGFDKFCDEANQGRGLKVKKWMQGYMTFVLPIIILTILVIGIINKFKG